MYDWIISLLVGLAVGAFSGLIGIGGGTILIPVLLFVYGFDIHSAVSTSILAITFIVVSSFTFYFRRVKIKYRLGTLLEGATIPGAILGSYIGNNLKAIYLEALFGFVLLALSIKMINDSLKKDLKQLRDRPLWKMKKSKVIKGLLGSFFAGFISGSVGISGGSIKVPLLILIVDIPERIAVATSTYMMILTTVSTLIAHSFVGKIVYNVGIPLGIGGFLGAQLGGRINLKLDRRKLRLALGFSFLVISVKILLSIIGI